MRDTSADWEKLAKDNAYWAVLTEDTFKGEPSAEAMSLFFESGRRDIEGIQVEIQRLYPEFAPPFETVIDFGCGTGRLLLPLARKAAHAFGIDISQTMRDLALANACAAGIDHVSFAPTPETLLKLGVKADWINSFIVLQHIEPRRGYFIINDLLQCVRPGGYASLHVPLFKSGERRDYYTDRVMYFRNDFYQTQTVFIDRDNYDHPDMQMYDYDANTVLALFHKNQMPRVHVIHDASSTGIHSFFFIAKRLS